MFLTTIDPFIIILIGICRCVCMTADSRRQKFCLAVFLPKIAGQSKFPVRIFPGIVSLFKTIISLLTSIDFAVTISVPLLFAY